VVLDDSVVHFSTTKFELLETRFDREFGVSWAFMRPLGRACFTPQLLLELRQYIADVVRNGAESQSAGASERVNYAVLASRIPGAFSLGGDLALFKSAIARRDRDMLRRYARMCVDDLLPWNRNFDLPVTTISLVQGSALGGGLEAALASSIVIAEESSRMGFPEVLFNLFPGMGAYSFLQRKVGRRTTDELITSGNTYTARQLYDLGVVDIVTPDGTGEEAVHSFVRRHARAGRGRRAFERVRSNFEAVSREELDRIAEIWVETALHLEERDLRMMSRLVRAQDKSTRNAPKDSVAAQSPMKFVQMASQMGD
jgi:DSF synthase